MQGFNRYVPPDYDPKKTSTLNSYQGKKHALGKRAKDIDKGVLIVRFELPFNVWCEGCGSHIGAGVRYNAQKKRVGNYHSTPIWAFRCKCHLCSSWFEVRTDPANAAYVVHEGAKRQNDEWDPVANGGFAPIDSETPSAADAPVDAFAATEKTIDQQQWARKNTSRLTELSEASDKQSLDPYEVSQNLRRRFRVEKAEMLEKQLRDEGVREKYGLGDEVDLGEEDVELARGKWVAARERAGLSVDGTEGLAFEGGDSVRAVRGTPGNPLGSTPSAGPAASATSTTTPSASPSLAQVLRQSTKRRYDPFADAADAFMSSSPASKKIPAPTRLRGKTKDASSAGTMTTKVGTSASAPLIGASGTPSTATAAKRQTSAPGRAAVKTGLGMLVGYGSD